eukprot:scaffold67377_cov28-Tisochrysis_lutea.AAC.2
MMSATDVRLESASSSPARFSHSTGTRETSVSGPSASSTARTSSVLEADERLLSHARQPAECDGRVAELGLSEVSWRALTCAEREERRLEWQRQSQPAAAATHGERLRPRVGHHAAAWMGNERIIQ